MFGNVPVNPPSPATRRRTVTIEWPVPKSETVPRPVKVSNPFCFDDPQVVLQASRIQVPSLVVLLAF